MPAPKNELEARVAALESQLEALLANPVIQEWLAEGRALVQQIEAGKLERAKLEAAREAREAELQAANVPWIEATVASNARQLKREEPGSPLYLEWGIGELMYGSYRQHERLYARPHDGRIQMRANAWAARLQREPELGVLVAAGEIVVRDLDRDAAIDLERRARAEERR